MQHYMIMPGVVHAVSGWKWQPDSLPQTPWLKLLYWVTESVIARGGIITHTVLCGCGFTVVVCVFDAAPRR